MMMLAPIGILMSVVIFYTPQYSYENLEPNEKNILRNLSVTYSDVYVQLGDLFHENSTDLNFLTSPQISDGLRGDSRGINQAINSKLFIFIVWSNLNKNLRKKVLDSTIRLQGHETMLSNIVGENSKALTFFSSQQIKNLVQNSSIDVGELFDPPIDFYIERMLTDSNADGVERRYNEIDQKFYLEYVVNVTKSFNDIKDSKVLILSDDSGTGKTTTLKQMAKNMKRIRPNYWIQHIDLKMHVKAFENQNFNSIELQGIESFISNNILKLRNLELEIFKELFERGQTLLIWDAIDEISNEIGKLLMLMTEKIYKNSQNKQWIGTRPQYESYLRRFLYVAPHKFVPFDENMRKKFIREYLMLKKIHETNITKTISLIENFIEKRENFDMTVDPQTISVFTRKTPRVSRFIYTPIMLILVAEVGVQNNPQVNFLIFNLIMYN